MKEFLIELLGTEQVLDDPETVREYSEDYTEAEPVAPGLVAFVTATEQVQAIVKEAGRTGVPITPRVSGTNVGGLTIPAPGGLVLDMSRMNRILEINEDDMYAVIEPGVTQIQIKEALEKDDLPLTLGYSLAPPDTSIFANALLGGLTNRSLKYGDQATAISALEVVRSDGSLMRTGAWAISEIPFGRVPLPDLTGLLVAWQGTTAIATRMAFQLWPKHPFSRRLFILSYRIDGTYEAMQSLCKKEICDDIGGVSWPAGKMLLGVQHPSPVPAPGEPLVFLYVDLTAETQRALDAKLEILDAVLKEVDAGRGAFEAPLDVRDLVKVNPGLSPFAEFPTELPFLTDHGGGGLTWIGTYGPLSRFVKGAEAGMKLMTDRGFPPLVVSRAMHGGHYGVLRFISTFDKSDSEEVARVRTLNRELLETVTPLGFIMYKTPVWAWQALSDRLDPGTWDMMQKVKKLMDPARIFNPGKLGL